MHKKIFQTGELLEVEIEKLTFGGQGLARYQKDGQSIVIFVPYSAPGDQLQVSISEFHKNYYTAEIEKILKPSTSRKNPECAVYGNCGGCNWQHITYEEQLKQKSAIVLDQLQKSGNTDCQLLPIQESPRPSHYRNRVQLKYDGKNLGFYARKSHEVVSSESCILMEDSVFRKHLVLQDELKKSSEKKPKIELCLNVEGSVDIRYENSPFDGEGFSQVNRFVNELLQDELLKWLSNLQFQSFFDLYAGAGNFSFPILQQFKKIQCTAVELNENSIQLARKRAESAKISAQVLKLYVSDVELFLKRQVLPKNSVVLLDPPRAGCSEYVVKSLAKSEAQSIFYISCDPACLSRDLRRFHDFGGWKVKRAKAFDMFPQTHHIETLVQLTH